MNKIILITGATSGIGRHAALYLAELGHTVIATGRRQHALDELKAEAAHLKLQVLRLDVTDAQSIAAAVVAVDDLTGGYGLDVLINNAGYGQGGAVLDVDDDAIVAQYETNVFGVIKVTRAFAPAMIARQSGQIIQVSSLGGRVTLPMMGVYNSTKFALESLSDAMRIELAPFNVSVVVVEPGSIATNFGATMQDTVVPKRTGPWAQVYSHTDSIARSFEQYSSGPIVISRVLARIVASRYPRARYMAPFREAFLIVLGTWLPSFVVDRILARIFGLHLATAPQTASVSLAA